MRILKKILTRLFNWISLSLIGVCALAATLIVVAWFFPQLWLTETTLRLASRLAPDIGVQVFFNGGLRVESSTTSLFGKRLKLVADRVCVAVPQSGLDICVDKIDLDVSMLLRFDFKITRVDRLIIEGARVSLNPEQIVANGEEPEKKSEPFLFDLPVGLKSASLGEIGIGLRTFRMNSRSGVVQASGRISMEAVDKGLVLAINGGGKYTAPTQTPEQIDAQIKLSLASRDLLSLKTADLNAKYRGSFLFPVALKANVDGNQLKVTLAKEADSKPVLHGDIQFVMQRNTLTLTKADGRFWVENFESVVGLLRRTPYAVPSPFNSLSGPIHLDANYMATADGKSISMPLKLVFKLAQGDQRLVADASGKLDIVAGEGTRLEADLNLSEVALDLPPLSIEKIPPIFPDSRILASDRERRTASDGESSFVYHFRIKTTGARSLLLSTNFAKAPVPVELDLTLQSYKSMSGEIKFGGTPLEVFRRNAALQSATLNFPGTDLPPTLKADLKVRYAEYTVFVHFFGTIERPDFFLTSDPPLSEQDALSVLLFGRTASEIDSSESESLAGTRAAIANRAIGLASMYLLATTPIESVGYDPVANTVSTRVRLRDGTTLSVKSSTRGVAGVGIKQRLGGPWSIRTEIENLEQQQTERSASAVLEWSKRY
jgi:hypothetical protein